MHFQYYFKHFKNSKDHLHKGNARRRHRCISSLFAHVTGEVPYPALSRPVKFCLSLFIPWFISGLVVRVTLTNNLSTMP